jgi:nucleoside-diphosphate-sugar epimerase
MAKILLTGGTGFIGSHIFEYFTSQGDDIALVTRQIADLRDVDALQKAFDGAECVIHNAARASDWGRYDEFYRDNVVGTINVLQACKYNGIRQVIITSSCSVYGEEDFAEVKDENSPQNSHYNYLLDKIFPCGLNFYRDTKRIAKENAIEFASENNISLTIIEPVWVYGEREFHTGFYEYLKLAKAKMPLIMGSKKNKFHVIYVRDLAKAYYLAYQQDRSGSFIIAPPNADYMNDIYTEFCKVAGYTKPRNVPKWVMYPVGFFMELFCTIFNTKSPPPLTRGRVNMFYDSIEYSGEKARRELGFECEYTLKQGIENTIKWYKENDYL